MNTRRIALSLLIMAVFFLMIAVTMEDVKEEDEEMPSTPWFETGDELGDELSRLSTDELRELAKTNESVRELIEEDMKIDPVKIESIEDLEHLPENYPEELKRKYLEDLGYAPSNQSLEDAESNNTSMYHLS